MEFLVNITLRWPDNFSDDQVQKITGLERSHANELIKQGKLLRMWRVPGRFANWGLWKVKDATELHETITGLPANPYMINIDVHALARHPVDPNIAD